MDGRRVVVSVRVRRLCARFLGCPRHTFREQVPGVVERYQRRTNRLASQLGCVVRELAGRAGRPPLSRAGLLELPRRLLCHRREPRPTRRRT